MFTSSKLSRQWFAFSLKVKVTGSNPGHLLKSVLHYSLLKISPLKCIGCKITLKQIHFYFCCVEVLHLVKCSRKDFSPFFLQVFLYITNFQADSSFFILERANVSHRPLLQVMYIQRSQRTIKKYILSVGWYEQLYFAI